MFCLSQAQVDQYQRDGFLLLADFFPRQDMDQLLAVARADRHMASAANERHDSQGRVSRLSLRFDLPEDIYGAYVRSERIVGPMTQLVGAEVFHYHHKMMLKEPRVGGAWEWHQDYGYWYDNFLYADMASCMIAVDRASRENGCLQVLRGSHLLGRIPHGQVGDQTGADAGRVKLAQERLEQVHCQMEPGSVLFFHCNLLHRSDPNTSNDPRWALICCYSAAHNEAFNPAAQGEYTPLETWDRERILAVGQRHWDHINSVVGGQELNSEKEYGNGSD